jgi:prepilin-type N-terminal cleavage/methylation domain-containing protein
VQEHKQDKNLIEQGFTLIELLVVIAILGILAAVVVFSVQGITNKGNKSACQAQVATVTTAVQAYYAQNNAFPGQAAADNSVADLGTTLVTAKLLAAGSVLPGSAAPAAVYNSATGSFTDPTDC